jgi:hypothetical protein
MTNDRPWRLANLTFVPSGQGRDVPQNVARTEHRDHPARVATRESGLNVAFGDELSRQSGHGPSRQRSTSWITIRAPVDHRLPRKVVTSSICLSPPHGGQWYAKSVEQPDGTGVSYMDVKLLGSNLVSCVYRELRPY